ncbi:hypothetical protein BJ944DRAFT_268425 [Cunninghamella echinulata]|nr:hypothetical protein BJ944DRAFT_268425 [Cunninghamella echinulata]
MIQSSLYNYLNCNQNSNTAFKKPAISTKQTSLYDYFIKPIGIRTKNQKSILEYFNVNNNNNNNNKNVYKKKKKETLEITLVDISNTHMNRIRCVKEDLYNESLKYIAISYRWGQVLPKQHVKTPDYTAEVTSFSLSDLFELIFYIRKEPDLKNIPYLWIDAISIDQQNEHHLKSALYHMATIYKRAAYLLAVPDLHLECLKINIANQLSIDLIMKNNQLIYESLQRYFHHSSLLKKKGVTKMINSFYKIAASKDELKLAYDFLQYLLDDWSHRTWIISEYHIGKSKETPMKFIFIMLLHNLYSQKPFPFFSYSFCHPSSSPPPSSTALLIPASSTTTSSLSSSSSSSITSTSQNLIVDHPSIDKLLTSVPSNNNNNYNNNNNNNATTTIGNKKLTYESKFIHSFEYVLLQRHYLDMILNSNTTKNEDRFYAILPIWHKYKHILKDKNTIAKWNITDMISVRLKLYEFMDLWDKARLLKACSSKFVRRLPSFASVYYSSGLELKELDDPKNANIHYYNYLKKDHSLVTVTKNKNETNVIDMTKKKIKKGNKKEDHHHHHHLFNAPFYKANLLLIQLIHHATLPTLNLKSSLFFICKSDHDVILPQTILNELKLDINKLKKVMIPYFMYSAPTYNSLYPEHIPAGVTVIGSFDENKWVLEYPHHTSLNDYQLIDHIDYTFCIY